MTSVRSAAAVTLVVVAQATIWGAGPELVSIAEVKRLPAAEIAARPAVRIRGVVTRVMPGTMFVQDESGGIYVNVSLAHDRGLWQGARADQPAAFGDEVEIEGRLDRGGFSPPLLPRSVRVIGPGRVPAARACDTERFFCGADDGDLVEISGVVQNVIDMERVWRLTLRAAGNTVLADVAKSALTSDAEALVDGVARIAGPTASVFTTRGEFIMPRVNVDRPEWLTVVEPARPDPFESPSVPLDGLARYRYEPFAGHRVRSAGVVVHAVPGHSICLQDGPLGIRVQTKSMDTFVPGDRVEVAGFVDRSGGVAGLANSVVRRTGAGPAPQPFAVSPADILDVNRRAGDTALMATPGDYEGCLVQFPARLVEFQRTFDGGSLVLDAAGTLVNATADAVTWAGLRDIRVGSAVDVTGIARLQWRFDPQAWPPRTAEAVRLTIRSPADVAVVRAASWWTPHRLTVLAGSIATAFAAAVAWLWVLRWQVAGQARALTAEMQSRHEAEVEFEAALRERNRLAANLHDTVLQTVTGIGFQLQAWRAAGDCRGGDGVDHAGMAERMVDHAVKQLRGTVWALHELPPTGGSLADGLKAFADRLGEEHGTTIQCREEGSPVDLDDTVSGVLLLVAQEALHNALRHARATSIEMLLRNKADGGIVLVVCDDGRGFDTGTLPGPSRGHFGVEGMLDRMQRIGGSLHIGSRPGAGTRVTAAVPAAAKAYLSDRTVGDAAGSGPIHP